MVNMLGLTQPPKHGIARLHGEIAVSVFDSQISPNPIGFLTEIPLGEKRRGSAYDSCVDFQGDMNATAMRICTLDRQIARLGLHRKAFHTILATLARFAVNF